MSYENEYFETENYDQTLKESDFAYTYDAGDDERMKQQYKVRVFI